MSGKQLNKCITDHETDRQLLRSYSLVPRLSPSSSFYAGDSQKKNIGGKEPGDEAKDHTHLCTLRRGKHSQLIVTTHMNLLSILHMHHTHRPHLLHFRVELLALAAQVSGGSRRVSIVSMETPFWQT